MDKHGEIRRDLGLDDIVISTLNGWQGFYLHAAKDNTKPEFSFAILKCRMHGDPTHEEKLVLCITIENKLIAKLRGSREFEPESHSRNEMHTLQNITEEQVDEGDPAALVSAAHTAVGHAVADVKLPHGALTLEDIDQAIDGNKA